MAENILITEHGCKEGEVVSCQGIHFTAPEYLLLSERMGDGETLEELADKARRIIESAFEDRG